MAQHGADFRNTALKPGPEDDIRILPRSGRTLGLRTHHV